MVGCLLVFMRRRAGGWPLGPLLANVAHGHIPWEILGNRWPSDRKCAVVWRLDHRTCLGRCLAVPILVMHQVSSIDSNVS